MVLKIERLLLNIQILRKMSIELLNIINVLIVLDGITVDMIRNKKPN